MKLASIFVFMATLWLGLIGTWAGWGQVAEWRVLAPTPRLDRTLPEGTGLYVRDHFGFRGRLVEWNAWLSVRLLRTSPNPDVIIGRDGFLFLRRKGTVRDHRWDAVLEKRRRWVEARGMRFVVMIAPDKESVYPEMMGRSIPSEAALTPILKSRKAEYPTYYKTDSHWTDWGAYCAYRAIAPQLGDFTPLELADLDHGVATRRFDLTRMLGLNEWERADTFGPRGVSVAGTQDDSAMVSTGGKGPRMVFFRDSFGATLMPFLAAHFSRIYAPNRWSFDGAVVQREAPAIVLLEIVERRLREPPPADSGLDN